MSTIAVGGTFWRSPGWPVPAWVHDNAANLCTPYRKLNEMLAPNVPPMEMRSPGATMTWPKGGLAGLGIIAVPAPQQYINGGGAYILGPSVSASPGPPNVVEPAQLGPTMGPIQTNPIFYDNNGNIIASAVCGSVYNMTVQGYDGQTLQIVQTKNGAPNFSGPLLMPVRNYASVCGQDEGTYNVQAFTQPGTLLGSTTFIVYPAGGAGGAGPSGLPSVILPPGVPISTSQGAPGPIPGVPQVMPGAAAGAAATTAPTSALGSLTTSDWMILGAVILGAIILGQGMKGR